jgi:hypothetical protein
MHVAARNAATMTRNEKELLKTDIDPIAVSFQRLPGAIGEALITLTARLPWLVALDALRRTSASRWMDRCCQNSSPVGLRPIRLHTPVAFQILATYLVPLHLP